AERRVEERVDELGSLRATTDPHERNDARDLAFAEIAKRARDPHLESLLATAIGVGRATAIRDEVREVSRERRHRFEISLLEGDERHRLHDENGGDAIARIDERHGGEDG